MLRITHTRPSDLSTFGLFGVALTFAGGAYVAWHTVLSLALGGDLVGDLVLGGLVVVLGSVMAYQDAKPEVVGACDACGLPLRAHSSRDTADEVVRVHASGPPRRLEVGPLSVVLEEQTVDKTFCSGECAGSDARLVVDEDLETVVASPTPRGDYVGPATDMSTDSKSSRKPTATDGGREGDS